MGSKGRPYRTVSIDGFDVLVGRGDAENDILTFDVARPTDLWMHVAGAPGSHVIVRTSADAPSVPPAVIERAARLAAWYSKARRARRVEVHVCRAGDVSKPPGWPPGKVLLKRWNVLRVRPEAVASDHGSDDTAV